MAKTISEKIVLLNRIALESISDNDKLSIIKKFTDTGIKILEADFGFTWWKASGKKNYQLAYKSPGTPDEPKPPRKRDHNYLAQKNQMPVFVLDSSKEHYGRQFGAKLYIKSYAVIPIIFKEHSYGNIVLCFKRKKHFSEQDQSLSTSLGNAAAQALTIHRLHINLRSYKKILDSTFEPILLVRPDSGKIIYANRAAEGLSGKTKAKLGQAKVAELLPQFEHTVISRNKSGQEHIYSRSLETQLIVKDRPPRTVRVTVQPVELAPWGQVEVLVLRDISERKRSEKRMIRYAYYDHLTGLPNRMHFEETVHQFLSRKSKNARLSIMLVDLDRFKFVNDILGHRDGDTVLIEAGKRLKKSVRKSDIVFRLGGDEFVILLRTQSHDALTFVGQRILDAFQIPFLVRNQEVYLNVSIGISSNPADGTDFDSLFKSADHALYRAKDEGGNAFKRVSGTILMPHGESDRWQLEAQLRQAIKREEFVFYYQPLYSLKNPDKIIGAEALIRWQHPKLGILLPSGFIKHLEESGLINKLTTWQFAQVCKLLTTLKAQRKNISISINISARQLLQQGMLASIKDALDNFNIDPRLIKLELTETLVIKNLDTSKELITQLQSLGLSVFIDDFGTGHASLNYLKNLPINGIKIDQSFIQNMLENSKDLALVKVMLRLGQDLGLEVIAEGVENKKQHKLLKNLDCAFAQGDLYCQAIDEASFFKKIVGS